MGLTVTVSAATLFRLEALTANRGITRAEAVAEAVRDWTLKAEAAMNRDGRLDLERRMREGLVQVSSAESGDIGPAGALSAAGDARVVSVQAPAPVLKERRVRAGLSQQKLAELAECSLGTVRTYENGLRAKTSSALDRIEQALADAEGEMIA